MATLHVRNVPNDLYASLRRRAAERKTSITKETLRLLERAVRSDQPEVRDLLEEIEANRPVARPGSPSGAELIREERDRR